ncbi:MAG: hypothetical protein WBE98_07495 [Gammaproteobacteria bacterium]
MLTNTAKSTKRTTGRTTSYSAAVANALIPAASAHSAITATTIWNAT